jgi:hypothetical protein
VGARRRRRRHRGLGVVVVVVGSRVRVCVVGVAAVLLVWRQVAFEIEAANWHQGLRRWRRVASPSWVVWVDGCAGSRW